MRNEGFSLIELLVVLVIIGILTSIAVPQFTEAREKAYFAAMKSDLRNLTTQQEIHHATNFEYSDSFDSLGFRSSQGVNVDNPSVVLGGWSTIAKHDALSNSEGCAVYMGAAAPPSIGSIKPTFEGEIACTNDVR